MTTFREDTIAAIATPIGEGGISVVRLSGSKAIEIADRAFRGRNSLASVATHTAHFGRFVNSHGDLVDDVVSTVFKQPHSYTGEDVVEVSCHGGMYLTKIILAELLDHGARMAEPGEFTKRAFLNGRIDLSQAEAVADLIKARTEAAQITSIQQLEGRLSSEIRILRERLINLVSLIELELDFVEEGLEFVTRSRITDEISVVEDRINSMIDSYGVGKIYREGVKVVLCGRPNVGKSSIFNMLLNSNRAIVTNIPGTTRDTIEESININGVIFTLNDTAGIRESDDTIENEGVLRTKAEIETADILLFIIDLSEGYTKTDSSIIENLAGVRERKLMIIENKCDLINGSYNEMISSGLRTREATIVSAKTGFGLETLREKLSSLSANGSGLSDKSVIVTNIRHVNSLRDAHMNLEKAKLSLQGGCTGEFVALDLRATCNSLGEIIGEVTSDDILTNIFSKFCIGK